MNTTDTQALLDKQIEGIRDNHGQNNIACNCDEAALEDLNTLLKTIDQYKRLMKWNQHDSDCGYFYAGRNLENECTCGLSAERESIRKEIEGCVPKTSE